jgi:hypothetical protein
VNIRYRIAAALIAAASMAAAAQRLSTPLGDASGLRLTDSCAREDAPTLALVAATAAFRAEIIAAVGNRSQDPALLRALWLPVSARPANFTSFEDQVILDYVDRFQDVGEIVRAINADASLTARGLSQAFADHYACFSPPPAPGMVQVFEYYHPQLNHYQLAVGDLERGALASSGWLATGESFRALQQGECYGATMVFRFSRSFAAQRGSDFLTVDPAECGQVRKYNGAWRPRDIPFYASAAQGGTCQNTYAALPVYRLYNRREMFNDMNHRYTINTATYARMIAQGWSGEGAAFCVAGT